MLKFTHREPIGSSTFPMPGDEVDYKRTAVALDGKVPAGRETSTLYIHIPFCDQICSFCAFNKAVSSEPVKNQYVKALIKEMEMYGGTNYVQGLDIQAVYIGGGTPNSLSNDDLKAMLAALRANFPLSDDCEISLEGTPQNFTPERNGVLLAGGVNRVSAGIQTFDRTIRQAHLHMNDGEEELERYIGNIKASFPNFNLDMIYNLPNQTDDIWKRDLRLAMDSGSRHLTVYPLVLLESTIFYSDYVKNKKYDAPAEDREIDLFKYSHEQLMTGEYSNDYSIRDYAKPGYECRYIRLNAEANQILALGAGAHGYLAGQTYHNEKKTQEYIRTLLQGEVLPIAGQRFTTEYEEMQRFMVISQVLEGILREAPRYFGKNKPFYEFCIQNFGEDVLDLLTLQSGYNTLKHPKLPVEGGVGILCHHPETHGLFKGNMDGWFYIANGFQQLSDRMYQQIQKDVDIGNRSTRQTRRWILQIHAGGRPPFPANAKTS